MAKYKTTRPYIKDISKATKRASNIKIKLHQSLHQNDEEHDSENETLEWILERFKPAPQGKHLVFHMQSLKEADSLEDRN